MAAMDALFSWNYIERWSVVESYARCAVYYYLVPKLIQQFMLIKKGKKKQYIRAGGIITVLHL